MKIPKVYKNGPRWLQAVSQVLFSLKEALGRMPHLLPLPTEFPEGTGDYKQAVDEHNDRLLRLHALIRELTEFQDGISKQLEKK
jgi:hypothetical protein